MQQSTASPRSRRGHRLRILFLNDWDFTLGGSQRYLETVALELRRRGHAVFVLASDLPAPAGVHTRSLGDAHFRAINYSSLSRFWKRIRNSSATRAIHAAIHDFQPDIIHYNYGYHHLSLAALTARDVPIIASLHDLTLVDSTKYAAMNHPLFEAYIRFYTMLARRRLRAVTACVAPSEYVRSIAANVGVRNVHVIPNGVEPITSSPVPHSRIILYVGALEHVKGPQLVVAAMPAVLRRDPCAKLVIVGTGALRASLEAQAASLGISRQVTFTGEANRKSVTTWYRRAQVVVIPSIIPENFPLVKAEAMLAGRPIVASESGGLPEDLRSGQNALVVPVADIPRLSVAIGDLISDHRRAQRLGAAAAKAGKRFTIRNHVDALEALYRKTVQRTLI